MDRIILVHGTWGRRSGWTFPDSALHARLGTEFPDAKVERFEWSGKNRHRARAEAAAELGRHIDAEPAGHVVLVGHSHGGSVAERTLIHRGWGRADGERDDVGAVTVGTPFLHFHRNVGSPVPVLDWVRMAICLGGIVAGVLLLGGQVSADVEPVVVDGEFGPPTELNDFSVGLAFTTWIALGIAAIPLLVLLLFHAALLIGRVDEVNAPLSPFPGQRVATLQVIRTRRDEAAGLLRFGRLMGGAVDLTRRFGSAPAALLGVMAIVLIVLGNDISDTEDTTSGSPFEVAAALLQVFLADNVSGTAAAEITTILFATLVFVGVAGILLTQFAVAEALLCGTDGGRLLRRGRVRIDGVPNADDHQETVVALTTKRFGLRHSRLMSDPASVDAIVAACRAQLDESA